MTIKEILKKDPNDLTMDDFLFLITGRSVNDLTLTRRKLDNDHKFKKWFMKCVKEYRFNRGKYDATPTKDEKKMSEFEKLNKQFNEQ